MTMKTATRERTVGDDVSVCQEVLGRYSAHLSIATGGMGKSTTNRQVSGRGTHGSFFVELVQETYGTWS